ncbi:MULTISPECIES: patatin-like phospholipase family protein [Acetobacter]|uniref:patatin-like phospholipase family protein n=1 Tax=Acetobacter TaxID=434 RepID=UPI0013C36697|nr:MULTISPECIES: patatin-like phospholipase family protein [Acetobacter]
MWEYFNTISGTSTGSIIAAGLSIDQGGGHALSPETILSEYKKDLFKINGYRAGENWFFQSYDVIKFLITNDPIYKIDGVENEIENIFLNKTISTSLSYLVILFVSVNDGGFAYATNENVSFPNYWFQNKHMTFSSDKMPISKIIISSSSALPYFALSDFKIPLSYELESDLSKKEHPHEFVGADGGFYQNDPVFLSISESRRKFGSDSNIHVVSLGTGLSPRSSYETMDDTFTYPVKGLGVLFHLAAGLMRSSSSVANEYFLTDPTIEYFRIDRALPSGFKENIADSSNENTKNIQCQANIISNSAHEMIHKIALELFESKFPYK